MANRISALKNSRGFTMIELIVVVSVLGILSIVAIPKLFNIKQDAQEAATNGIAGALAAANAENYAVRLENRTNGQHVLNCMDVANLLQSGLPIGYAITELPVGPNDTVTCGVTGPMVTGATFTATGIA
jgi:MSHA pilin protein MshA